ncbi:hypothetical protein [Erythrobacter sp. YT30]|uniref:hypothetical protein n=1 Tax=Erythrobacter sp. YT30 TaxID=1735012 RepID=UPI000AF0A4D7|nr:hypothetical protein [Erythrobacter sp. YT30]
MTSFHRFKGSSGTWYQFAMASIGVRWASGIGVYIFARIKPDGNYDILYVGRSSDLANRPSPSHEKFEAAKRLGMTHVGAAICATERLSDAAERDLIAKFSPPLNQQLVSPIR